MLSKASFQLASLKLVPTQVTSHKASLALLSLLVNTHSLTGLPVAKEEQHSLLGPPAERLE